MKIGTRVRMVNCYEAEKYAGIVWVTRSESWDVCGKEVVLLEGYGGGFAVACLEVVADAEQIADRREG